MLRNVTLPFLPGYNFCDNTGKAKFHKPHFCEYYRDIQIVAEKRTSRDTPPPSIDPTVYPSAYPRSSEDKFPTWLKYDKQVLSFDAYFQSTVQEVKDCPYQVRRCKICFYLENGTIQVIEPKERNSGIPQGTLIHRQHIRKPPPCDDFYYDITDFNIGKEVELYGRVFKIINCDRFTRIFLNRIGIPVPDPIECPDDPYMKIREKEKYQLQALKPAYKQHNLSKFLAHDRQVLRFWGYWDDRPNPHGLLHRLRLQYYLADDTVDIKEEEDGTGDLEMGPMFLKRSKLPKTFTKMGLPGDDSGNPMTVLNVLGPSIQRGRYIYDSLTSGRGGHSSFEYITDKDLSVGAVLDVYGRTVVLTSCDPFTQEYYRSKYGIDNSTPAPDPFPIREEKLKEDKKASKIIDLPPYNGYGTFEDSMQNCLTVVPHPPKTDFKKFLEKDRQGLESHVLRFEAEMIFPIVENDCRKFLINYHLCDDTIAISVKSIENTGPIGGRFLKRGKIMKPGQKLFSSKPPEYYSSTDFYVGAVLTVNEFQFLITNADEYALSYMEKNCNEFSRSNVRLIMDKLKEALTKIYKDFVGKYLSIDPEQSGVISYQVFRKSIKDVLGDDITDQEILTLARSFPGRIICTGEITLDELRPIVHTELLRNIFQGLERMTEDLLQRDVCRTGWLPFKEIWASCRASRVPLSPDMLKIVIEKLDTNPSDSCMYSYKHLIQFLDTKIPPPLSMPHLPYKELIKAIKPSGSCKVRQRDSVNYAELLKCLNLEEELLKQNK